MLPKVYHLKQMYVYGKKNLVHNEIIFINHAGFCSAL